jgi:hypothetical protein
LTTAGGACGTPQVLLHRRATRGRRQKRRERGTEQADLDADRLSRTVTSKADLIYKTLLSWLLLSQNQCLRP